MSELELLPDTTVIHCPDCPASLAADDQRATLVHCEDGSHIYGVEVDSTVEPFDLHRVRA